MTREQAIHLTRATLDKWNLSDWHVRLTTDLRNNFLGLCMPKDKCIILNAHRIDSHPDPEIENTIYHEVAHCLTLGHGHDNVWADKAREVGCTSIGPCSHLSFSPQVIDAIRSGATVEVTYETEIIHKPKYTITRLQDKCEICGKIAKERTSILELSKSETLPDKKYIFLECGHLITKLIPKGTPFQLLKSDDGKVPYPYQVEGMQFIEAALSINKGGAVFDEMGLGKTIQALGYIKFHEKEITPVLFVLKSGVKFQWFKEMLRWIGDHFVAQIISSSNDILIPGLKAYIISYDMLVYKERRSKTGKTIKQGFDISKFDGIKLVVLDECQQIKNPDSSRTQQVRRICKDKPVIALSGTPWKNRGSEFFTILNMMAPTKFPSYQGFLDRWVDFYMHGNRTKEGGIRNPARFKEYIKDIAIRRERREVMKELPLITRNANFTELDSLEQKEYDEEVSEFVKWYNDKVMGGEEDDFSTTSNLVAKMQRMRHIVGLAKIPATVGFAKDFVIETERKLVIFVHHKDVGEIITRQLKEYFEKDETIEELGLRVSVFKLTAELGPAERFEMQENFNKISIGIMIASTLAAGEGLNLQTCADCIMHERQWNPANEEQAEGRFIRIGQESDKVTGTYVTAAGTIDEHLHSIVERKRTAFHSAMNRGEIPTWNQGALLKELAEKIVNDHNKKGGKITKMVSLAR